MNYYRIAALSLGLLGLLCLIGLILGTSIVPFDGDSHAPLDEVLMHGTNPLQTDTDGDGLSDSFEISREIDALATDTDGDGLEDGDEIDANTNPTLNDTDDDGLGDGYEVRNHLSPTNPDTDGDGLTDGRETNLNSNPKLPDSDGDGLTDGTEVTVHNTSPTKADTDGDGWSDGFEISYRTSPTKADTDEDGIEDAREQKIGTNATKTDTDGDGFPDGAEYFSTEPFLETASPLHKDVVIEVDSTDTTQLTRAEERALIETYAEAPVENPDGESGITLHVIRSEQSVNAGPLLEIDAYMENQYKTNYDYAGKGVHHVLLVEQASAGGRPVGGVTYASSHGVIVSHSEEQHETGVIILHELGHSLGLVPRNFNGVDSRAYDTDDYRSVMNYNGQDCRYYDNVCTPDDYFYSSEEPFDDWEFIEQRMWTPYTGNLSVGR